MFYVCTNIISVKCLATENIHSDNVNKWLYGVDEDGIFYGAVDDSNWQGLIPDGWSYVKE